MAKINRSDIIQRAVNDCAISVASDKVPTETLDKVQLTYDLNPKYTGFVESATKSTTGVLSLVLPTIDSRSEIYLTSLDADFSKDAACDISTGSLTIQIIPAYSGTAKTVIQWGVITLTAQNGHVHADFPYPIKLKPNTNISFSGIFAAGVFVRVACATGFITSSN